MIRLIEKYRNMLAAPQKRAAFLAVAVLLIFSWQFSFYHTEISEDYKISEALGLNYKKIARFVYFYHYLGYYPVATLYQNPPLSKSSAEEVIKYYPQSLVNDYLHVTRFGDHGRIWLFQPDLWLKGSPETPSVKTFNFIIFFLALAGLFISFHLAGKTLIGTLLVLLIGSNPFQIQEIYGSENIFGLPVATCLIVLALNTVFIFFKDDKFNKKLLWLPVLTGISQGFFSQIRNDHVLILLSCVLIYLLVNKISWRNRFLLIGCLAISFLTVKLSIKYYFDYKYDQAVKLVKEAGGMAYEGPRGEAHPFWHPIYIGLGEFGNEHGYQQFGFRDITAYKYVFPELQKRIYQNRGEQLTYDMASTEWPKAFYFNEAYDQNGYYLKKFEDYSEYNGVLQEKILADVKADPVWILKIIGKRCWLTLTELTPIELNLGFRWLSVYLPGYLFILLCGLLLYQRKWPEVKLLLFSAPLAVTSLIMWAGFGNTYYQIYHLFGTVILISVLSEWYLKRKNLKHVSTDK